MSAEILIVDDEPENIWPLVEYLEKDYNVLVAPNGRDAVEIATSDPKPDLILLDIVMPDMDGYEVLSRLKADDASRQIPVIFVTGQQEEAEEIKGMELGALDYITKPFSMAVVRARIKSAINLKKEEDRRFVLKSRLEGMNDILQAQVDKKIQELEDAKQALFAYEEKYRHLFNSSPPGNERATLLIVDDNPHNIQILIENLESDYEIICTTSGPEALDICFGENRPDLVLLDIMMPHMDGYEVCTRLKANPETLDLPVIFLTALGQEVDEAKGLNIGGVDFITKPFSLPVVDARIKAALRLKKEISSREVLTRQLAKLNENLEHQIQEKTLALEQAHAHIKESEEKFRAIFQDAVEGIYQTTPKGQLISASPSLARMMGYDSGEEMVDRLKDLARDLYYDPEDRRVFLKEIRKKGEVRDFETRFKTKSGTPIWCLVSAKAVRGENDKILYYQGFIIDISARKKSALELQRLRIHMQNIINGMPSALVGMDLEGRVIHWNHEAELITGTTADAAKGQPLEHIFPQIAPGMEQARKAITECRIQKDSKVLTYVNGQVRYWDITVYPLIPDRCEGAVIRVDDVTEQIRMEEMMIQSEKMLSLGGLAAGMAHEINNPLSAIIQSCQVIQNRLTTDLPKNNTVAENCGTTIPAISAYMKEREIHAMLSAISESGKRAANIIENMLSFARKGDGHVSHYDLSDLISRTVNLARNDYNLKKNYDFRKIEIVREFDPDLPKIPCEASKIQQVLFNILRNGAQAMAAANGKSQKTCHRFVISLKKEGDMARMDIQDNGPGMDKETRRKIFEPFFTTKGRGVGTGLGLSVSYFIITENHKGNISVESSPGQGAKFIIRLPLTREMAN